MNETDLGSRTKFIRVLVDGRILLLMIFLYALSFSLGAFILTPRV